MSAAVSHRVSADGRCVYHEIAHEFDGLTVQAAQDTIVLPSLSMWKWSLRQTRAPLRSILSNGRCYHGPSVSTGDGRVGRTARLGNKTLRCDVFSAGAAPGSIGRDIMDAHVCAIQCAVHSEHRDGVNGLMPTALYITETAQTRRISLSLESSRR